jgi:hypothetical protein
MRTRAILLAALAGMACAPKPPATDEPPQVTLGWFEGEIDAAAGTFTVRPAPPPAEPGWGLGRLVVPEGASALGIANPKSGAGSPTKVSNGCGAGKDSLEAIVTITLNYPAPQFVGGIYAEITTLDPVTGYTACNSAPVPDGLSDQYGLWSYGTLRPGAASTPGPWKFGYPSGAAPSKFAGRIVGVPGTTLPVTSSLPRPENPGATRSPTIVYERERMAYVALGGTINYVGLDGAATGSPVAFPAGQAGRSLAYKAGAVASADLLWFTTGNYVGVVYQGVAYSLTTSDVGLDPWDGLGSIVLDPTTPNRAWFLAQWSGLYCGSWSGWFRSVDFTPPGTLTLGAERRIPCDPCANPSRWPYALAIAPPRSGSGSTDPYWFYITGNDATPFGGSNYFEAYDSAGNVQQDLQALPGYPAACHIPFTPIVGPGNVLWFGGYRDAGYPGDKTYLYDYSFCSYDPATNAFAVVPISTRSDYNGASGAAGVGPAVGPGGSGSVVWGIDMRPDLNRQSVRQLVGAADAQFAVEWAVASGWDVASIASSPAVTVGAVDHPAYLWVTTANGVLRLQP